jgi:hypothetical protein
MKRKSEPRAHVTSSSRTNARSPLSNMPFVKGKKGMVPAALPVRWADDMQPYIRKPTTRLEIDETGTHETVVNDASVLTPLAFIDELEESIEKSGGIENVMVLPDGMDVQTLIDQEVRRRDADAHRDFLRKNFGIDV